MLPEEQLRRLQMARMNPAIENRGNAIQGNRYDPNTNLGILIRQREAREAHERSERRYGGFIH